jgi:hypothetical protein
LGSQVGALEAVGGTVGTGAPQSGSHADDDGEGSGTVSEDEGHPVTRLSKPKVETAKSGTIRFEVMVDEIPLSLRSRGGTLSLIFRSSGAGELEPIERTSDCTRPAQRL